MNKKIIIISVLTIAMLTGCAKHGGTTTSTADAGDTVATQTTQETGIIEQTEEVRECEPYYNNPDDWYDSNGNIVAPISLDEDKWQSSPFFEDRCSLCAIPQSVIDKASTEELARLVIGCKLNYLIDLYSDVDDGMQSVYKNYNGIRELLKRDDCGAAVLKIYSQYTIPEKKNFDYSLIDESLPVEESNKQLQEIFANEEYSKQIDADAEVGYNLHVPEWILTQSEIMEQFSGAERETLIETVKLKYEELNKTEFKDEGNYFLEKTEFN